MFVALKVAHHLLQNGGTLLIGRAIPYRSCDREYMSCDYHETLLSDECATRRLTNVVSVGSKGGGGELQYEIESYRGT